MSDSPKLLSVLHKIRTNAYLGKRSHFNAANRQHKYNAITGVPVMVLNIVLGSVFFVMLSQDLPSTAKWIGALIAVLAAILSGVQTFFNYQKRFEGHRKIGNKYLQVESRCEQLNANYVDGVIHLEELSKELVQITAEYQNISTECEHLQVSDADYRKALKSKRAKEVNINNNLKPEKIVSLQSKVA